MIAHPNRHSNEFNPHSGMPSESAEAYEYLEQESRARIQESLRSPVTKPLHIVPISEMDDFASDLGSFIHDLDEDMSTSGAKLKVSGEEFDPAQIQHVLQMEMDARERQHRKAA